MAQTTRDQNEIREMLLDMKLPNEVAKLQLEKKNIFYDKFLIYSSLNDYSNEDLGYIKHVGGHWIASMQEETQRFVYKFPNGFGVAVARGLYTEGCWKVWDFKFNKIHTDKAIYTRLKHNKRKLDVTEVASSLEHLPSSYTNFYDVEKHLKTLYSFQVGKRNIPTKLKYAYLRKRYNIDL
ncbi:hypothetical protein ABEX78_20850 [Priestia megaterium]